jgi:hypothetical protein
MKKSILSTIKFDGPEEEIVKEEMPAEGTSPAEEATQNGFFM